MICRDQINLLGICESSLIHTAAFFTVCLFASAECLTLGVVELIPFITSDEHILRVITRFENSPAFFVFRKASELIAVRSEVRNLREKQAEADSPRTIVFPEDAEEYRICFCIESRIPRKYDPAAKYIIRIRKELTGVFVRHQKVGNIVLTLP